MIPAMLRKRQVETECVSTKNDQSLSVRKNELAWANETMTAIKEDRLALFAQIITPINKNANENLGYELLV